MSAFPTFTIQAQFDGINWTDITTKCEGSKFKRKMMLHNQLKPVINTCNFMVIDKATANLFNAAAQNVPIKIQQNGSPWFTGLVRPTYSTQLGGGFQGQTLQAYDYGIWLKKVILNPISMINVPVSDPTNKAQSVLHQLFYAAGFSDSQLNLPSVPSAMTFVAEPQNNKHFDIEIANILFEFGYVYSDPGTGVFGLVDLYPQSLTAVALTDATLLQPAKIQRQEYLYDTIRLTYYPIITIAGCTVFSDTTGGNSVSKANIQVGAGQYYPAGSDAGNVYSQFKVDNYDLITVNNAALAWSGIGVTLNSFTPDYTRAAVSFFSAAGGTITRFDIVGDAVLRDKNSPTILVNYVSSESAKIQDYTCQYITQAADAQRLSAGLAQFYQNAAFQWTWDADERAQVFSIGDILDLTDAVMGTEQKLRVIEVDTDQWGYQTVIAEGISPYTVTAGTSTVYSAPPPIPADQQRTVTPVQTATITDIEQGYTNPAGSLNAGTQTPTVPVVSAQALFKGIALTWDRQNNLRWLDHYDVQVSPDDTNWYSLKMDGTGWQGALNGVTPWSLELLTHAPIPVADPSNPSYPVLYYRVRRSTIGGVQSAWSTVVSATPSLTNTGDYALNSITANALAVGVLTALIAAVTDQLTVGANGIQGITSGQWRTLVTGTKVAIQNLVNSVWQNKAEMGGDSGDPRFDFFRGAGLANIAASLYSIIQGDPVPSGGELFHLDGVYTDQSLVNPWDDTTGTSFGTPSRFGSNMLTGTNGRLIDANGLGILQSAGWGLDWYHYLPGFTTQKLMTLGNREPLTSDPALELWTDGTGNLVLKALYALGSQSLSPLTMTGTSSGVLGYSNAAGCSADGTVISGNGAVARLSGGSWAVSALGSSGDSSCVSADGLSVLIGRAASNAADLYVWNGSAWALSTTLVPSDGASGDKFGYAVALSRDGSVAIVGAPFKFIGGARHGKAYVFRKTAGTWDAGTGLTGAQQAGGDIFGTSVSLSADGTVAVVGNPEWSTFAGYVDVFRYTSSWSAATQLSGALGSNAGFGCSVALSGDANTLAVGAPMYPAAAYTGAVQMYSWSGSSWVAGTTISASGGASNDNLGFNVALSPDGLTLAAVGSSKLYAFKWTGSAWAQSAVSTAAGPCVCLSGDGDSIASAGSVWAPASSQSISVAAVSGWNHVAIGYDSTSKNISLSVADTTATMALTQPGTFTTPYALSFLFPGSGFAIDDLMALAGTYLAPATSTAHGDLGAPWAGGSDLAASDLVIGPASGGKVQLVAQGGGRVGIVDGSRWHEIGAAGEPAFQNGWVNFGATSTTAAYRKDALGWVHLKGTVKNGTINTAVFTLPVGYAPAQDSAFAVANGSGTPGNLTIIASTRTVTPNTGGVSAALLDGISFYVGP